MTMKKIVVLSGAGISAESGLKTFRDSGGLWEGHDVTQVATPEAWQRDPELVLKFYNERRKDALNAQPNRGHIAIAELEEKFQVTVITQNVDSLHERAGSTHVIHLHGELSKARSSCEPSLVYTIDGWALNLGDKCEKGSQKRPHIVWFGEPVPMMELALEETLSADVFVVVGTSLQVYPAAGLLEYVDPRVPKYIVDPRMPNVRPADHLFLIHENAGTGMVKVKEELFRKYA
jgi:NAD-dependent deacetylase